MIRQLTSSTSIRNLVFASRRSKAAVPIVSSFQQPNLNIHVADELPPPQRDYTSTAYVTKKKSKWEDTPKIRAALEEFERRGNIHKMHSDMPDDEVEKMIEEEYEKMMQQRRDKYFPDWKPGQRKQPLVYSYKLEDFERELNPDKSIRYWTLLDKRCGALGIKVGMMPVWDDWGERHPCTVLFLDTNIVLGHKIMDKHGYTAVQIAGGERKRKNVNRAIIGQYGNVPLCAEQPPYIVREFRVTSEDDCLPPIGSRIHASHFVPGQAIDIAGISKGKGFQGGMKRHNFKGMPASHGVSKSHRAIGSTGQCTTPGRVFKGKKMPGRMGAERVTVQNQRIVKIDRGRNLLYVRGMVPGNKGEFVEIRDAVKRPYWGTDKVQDEMKVPPLPTFEYDDNIDGTGEKHEIFMPLPKLDPLVPDDTDKELIHT